jgi:hypothetical protein
MYIGIRSKVYSMIIGDDIKKILKGVPKAYVEEKLVLKIIKLYFKSFRKKR